MQVENRISITLTENFDLPALPHTIQQPALIPYSICKSGRSDIIGYPSEVSLFIKLIAKLLERRLAGNKPFL